VKIIFSLVLTILLAVPSLAENLVLVNGTIIDGTLKARAQGNVRVRDGKILDIGIFKPVPAEMLLDVKGLIVAPGFIDLRSRSADAQPTDGTTSVLLGSDGSGPYTVENFMSPLDEKPPSLNILTLVGHGAVRRQTLGTDYKRLATEEEIKRMSELVEHGMQEGAFGLSSAPGSNGPEYYANTDESIALAKAVAR
jgi:N-acyl-D-amino-acid deacylase